MPLEQLPDELLLTIASHLPDSATPKHLKSLSLTCRKLRRTAQEALFTSAKLAICCGCHPKVNALIKLLRTLLERPDLALKIRSLRFRAVRKCVEKIYAEQGFELLGLRDRCVSKLEELGYQSNHPWWRSINNCIESTFGGLLLALLPNLVELDFWIKDHQRGPPSSECISGLWGGATPPEPILRGWKNVKHLITGDVAMLKCGIELEMLTTLDLRTVSIGTVLRLNGPGSLQGAENVINLCLTVSLQFADRPLVEKADVAFSELLDALDCRVLSNLKIAFINDGYHIGIDMTTELSAGYFIDQLHRVEDSLETLSITFETTDDDGELEWLLDMCQHPAESLQRFSALRSLVVPQPFIFNTLTQAWSCEPGDLPPNLEQLELLWPHESVEDWAGKFLYPALGQCSSETSDDTLQERSKVPANFKMLILTCRDDAGTGATYFTEGVDDMWWELSTTHGIEAEVRDQLRDKRFNLAEIFDAEREERLSEDESDNIDEDDRDRGNEHDEGDRVNRFPEASQEAQSWIRERALELLGDETEDHESEADGDSSDRERHRARPNYLGELPDPPPSAVSAIRIAILKTLRDLPNPSTGMTENTILTRFKHMGSQSSEGGDDTWMPVQRAIRDLHSAGFIKSDDILSSDGSRSQVFAKPSIELFTDELWQHTQATIDSMHDNDDDSWRDDMDTDDDMPDLQTFDTSSGATIGPVVAPFSRVGLVTETAVLRLVRQHGRKGIAHELIASQLGTNYGEIILRVGRLRRKGYVREDEDCERVYFYRANAELLLEDES